MTIYSVIEHILFMSITIVLIGFIVAMLGFFIKKIIDRRKYGVEFDKSVNPLSQTMKRYLKASAVALLIFIVIGVFENADCMNAIYSDRPNAESYCQPRERSNDGF
jgi:hypothetical protein